MVASVLDTAILIGKESTYGTFAAPTRGYEAQSDDFADEENIIESIGFYAGRHTMVSGRRVALAKGAAGSLEFDVLNQGWGLLLQAMFGTVAGPTQVAATTAYETTVATDPDAPDASYSLQAQRVTPAGTTITHSYLGGVVTGWTLDQQVDAYLKATVDMFFSTSNNTDSAATPAYPSGAVPFHWGQMVATVNGAATDVTSATITADLGMKTDRYFLRASTAAKQPVRSQLPRFTGELQTEYANDTIFDLAKAGTAVPIIYTWTGDEIESGQNFTITLTMPECVFNIVSPSANVSDVPTIAMPFTVLWDESNPAMTLVYKSSDTAL